MLGSPISVALIDVDTIEQCAEQLHAEALGLSIRVDGQKRVRDVINDILKHIDGNRITDATTATVAQRITARLMIPLPSPLSNCNVECDRELYRVQMGDPIVLNWSPLDVFRMVMHVTSGDLGTLDRGTIKLGLIQGVFGATEMIYIPQADDEWERTSNVASPVENFLIT